MRNGFVTGEARSYPFAIVPAEGERNHLKLGAGQRRTIKFGVNFEFELGQPARRHAATLRAGGAMNSGPTGSVMVSRRIRSISAFAEASSDHPITSSTGRSRSAWRAPHNAVVMSRSCIQ